MAKFRVLIILSLFCLVGCSSLIAKTPKVILLPEERIFTVPAGQEISVLLDKKPLTMTFPEDMKLTSPTVLVRQEIKLNDAMLKKTKADSEKKAMMGIFGSILTVIAAGLGIFFKTKSWIPKIKANVEIK